MIRQRRRLLMLLVGSLLPACGGNGPIVPTGAVVEITSDFATPPLDAVELTVFGADTVFYDRTFVLASGSSGLPLRVGLEPHGDPNASFQVMAVGQVGGAGIVTRSATLHFIVGRVVLLELPLRLICQGTSCPGGARGEPTGPRTGGNHCASACTSARCAPRAVQAAVPF